MPRHQTNQDVHDMMTDKRDDTLTTQPELQASQANTQT